MTWDYRTLDDDLTQFERTVLSLAAGTALDYATNSAAIKYVGMPVRTLAATTLAITFSTYFAGMGLSKLIDEQEGVENYRTAINTIMTEPGGFKEVVHDSIFLISVDIERKTRRSREILWNDIPMKYWVPYV